MDFFKSYFFKNNPLISCPFLFLKIRFPFNPNIGETLNVKKVF
jgi:hypothetical protein